MNIRFVGLLFIIICFSACKDQTPVDAAESGNWPIFRGSPSLSAYTHAALPDHPILLWAFKSGSYTKSSPVVYNQIAYWSDRRGRILGINTAGEKVFDYALETAVDAIPMIHDSTLYIGRIDGILSAISLNKHDTLWNFETLGQISASPNIMKIDEKDAVMVGSYDNYLYSLDTKTGRVIKQYKSGYYINGAVALNDHAMMFGGCDGIIRVVDRASGMQTDSLDVKNYIPASPAMNGDWSYIADHSGNLYEIKLNKAKIVSSRKLIEADSENRSFVGVPAVSKNIVYMVSDDRYIYAINRDNGAIIWKYLLKGDTGESSPVVCRDKLLVCTKNGIVSMHDAQTGRLLWEYDTGEQITASPAVIDQCFYILTFKGTLFCFGHSKK